MFGGSGLIVMLLHSITSQFHLGGWVEYTIYYNLTYGPSSYASVGDLRGAAVGLAFLALYSAASVVAVRKRDIQHIEREAERQIQEIQDARRHQLAADIDLALPVQAHDVLHEASLARSMFNLLCMDLYRIKRSKFAYVCFGCLLGVIFLS